MRPFATMVSTLPSVSFMEGRSRPSDALLEQGEQLGRSLSPPKPLRAAARAIAAQECGLGRRDVAVELVKCAHNHIVRFDWDKKAFIHKLFSSPWGWYRDCLSRAFLAEIGLGSVRAPVAAEILAPPAADPIFFAVFGEEPALRPLGRRGAPSTDRSAHVCRQLGAWCRRLHEAFAAARLAVAAEPFRARRNRMFDVGDLLRRGVVDESHLDQVDRLSRWALDVLGDRGDSLVHNDLGVLTNILSRPDEPDGLYEVIDFEHAHIGFRHSDILWVAHDAAAHLKAFTAGYGCDPHPISNALLAVWGTLYDLVWASGHVFQDRPPCTCREPSLGYDVWLRPPSAPESMDRHLLAVDALAHARRAAR